MSATELKPGRALYKPAVKNKYTQGADPAISLASKDESRLLRLFSSIAPFKAECWVWTSAQIPTRRYARSAAVVDTQQACTPTKTTSVAARLFQATQPQGVGHVELYTARVSARVTAPAWGPRTRICATTAVDVARPSDTTRPSAGFRMITSLRFLLTLLSQRIL